MTSIYISSTYSDLIDYRDAVANVLRKMNKIVVAMEDYTSNDERPLDKCLADVARCDIYIGIFAHRYGYIPVHDNADELSITELEYKKACDTNKPRLIFILDEKVPWVPSHIDRLIGADGSNKITAFRHRLETEHTRSLFRSPDDLAASVSSAVSNFLEDKGLAEQGKAIAPPTPFPREISSDLLLLYLDADRELAADLADELKSRKLRVAIDDRALLADAPEDFERLERTVRGCHAATMLISDASLRQMEERRAQIESIVRIATARTANFFGLCLSDDALSKMKGWPVPALKSITGWRPRAAPAPPDVHQTLEALRLNTGTASRKQWVGLPIIAVAMTRQEADEIAANPEIVKDRLGTPIYASFEKLRAIVGGSEAFKLRYGQNRWDCAPFAGSSISIEQLLDGMVRRVNEEQPAQLRGRQIKLQRYEIDEVIRNEKLTSIFTQLAATGCVVVVDEYSLFHPDIHEMIVSSGLLSQDQVALVTLSPSDPYSISPFNLMEAELKKRMAVAFNRFSSNFDPQCELSVGDEKRLKRWFNLNLPHTIHSLRDPKPNRLNILQFAREQGLDPQPKVGTLLYSPGGPL